MPIHKQRGETAYIIREADLFEQLQYRNFYCDCELQYGYGRVASASFKIVDVSAVDARLER